MLCQGLNLVVDWLSLTAVPSITGGLTLNTYHYVLYVHLLALFVGIGAGSVLFTCLFQLRAARTLEAAVPWGMVSGKVAKLFPVAILGLFGTGAYMTSSFS